jgi:phosphomannomutase
MAKLNVEGKRIEGLIKDLKVPYESSDLRLEIKNDNFKDYGTKIIADLEEYVKSTDGFSIVNNNYDGVRVTCDNTNGDGWFLLRLSLHEPVLALNIESDIKGGIQIIMDKLASFLDKYNELDLSNIK